MKSKAAANMLGSFFPLFSMAINKVRIKSPIWVQGVATVGVTVSVHKRLPSEGISCISNCA